MANRIELPQLSRGSSEAGDTALLFLSFPSPLFVARFWATEPWMRGREERGTMMFCGSSFVACSRGTSDALTKLRVSKIFYIFFCVFRYAYAYARCIIRGGFVRCVWIPLRGIMYVCHYSFILLLA